MVFIFIQYFRSWLQHLQIFKIANKNLWSFYVNCVCKIYEIPWRKLKEILLSQFRNQMTAIIQSKRMRLRFVFGFYNLDSALFSITRFASFFVVVEINLTLFTWYESIYAEKLNKYTKPNGKWEWVKEKERKKQKQSHQQRIHITKIPFFHNG